MARIGRYLGVSSVLVALAAGCGGSSKPGASAIAAVATSAPDPAAASAPAVVGLATAASPMTCTVYEAGFATQVIFASQGLDVRAECRAWSGNKPGEGYLWGFQPATAAQTPADSRQVCFLTDPQRIVEVRVVLASGFRTVTPAQAARGQAACMTLRSFGWRRSRSSGP